MKTKFYAYVFRKGARATDWTEVLRMEVSSDLSIKDKCKLIRNLVREHNGDGGGIEHITN